MQITDILAQMGGLQSIAKELGVSETQATSAAEALAPAAPSNPDLRWYIVHAYSGMEKAVERNIIERITRSGMESKFGRILVPTEEVVEIKNGQKRTTERKFFPGYVLVEMVMDDETWHLVKHTNKVTGFVGGAKNRPAPISEADVAKIVSQMQEGTDKPRHPSNIPSQRPPRGNWPFTVSPQTPPTGATTRFVATNTDARAFIPSPAATRVACGSSRLADGSGCRAAKVLRRLPTSGGSGRLVIAGRMADVCAELDRLAASEAALQAC